MKNISIKVLVLIGLAVLAFGVLIGRFIYGGDPIPHGDSSLGQEVESTHPGSDKAAGEEWTCSMHPQIRQSEPGICPICEMDLIPVDNQISNSDPSVLQMTEASARLAQISTYTVGYGDPNNPPAVQISVDGAVELDERLSNSQTSHLEGRIEHLYVNFTGEYITKGQRIARLYSPDLLTASKELLTAEKFKEQISGVREATIRKLKNWKITDEQIAEILSSGKELETIDIYADHSGYVLDKRVSQGDYVKRGGVIYTLGQTSRIWLVFQVFESDLGSVRLGNSISFTTPAIRDREFEAKITFIDPLLDPGNRTAVVRAELSNPSNRLKPGMLLKGTIQSSPSSNSSDVLRVPKSAVLWTGKQSVVYVQLSDYEVPSFQFREVVLGASMGDFYEIEEGVEAGDQVVRSGAFVIDAAAQLNNQQSMMNKDISIKLDDMSGHPDFKGMTPDSFRIQLASVVENYLKVKNGLVETNPEISKENADVLLNALDLVDMNHLSGDAHMYWMEQEEIIRTHGIKLSQSIDVEEQRKQFDFLSNGLVHAVKAFGVNDGSLFVQFCPMAFNNKGAEWLSAESVIRNPYFGDKMMKCGSVLDSVTVAMNIWEDVVPASPPATGHDH